MILPSASFTGGEISKWAAVENSTQSGSKPSAANEEEPSSTRFLFLSESPTLPSSKVGRASLQAFELAPASGIFWGEKLVPKSSGLEKSPSLRT
ncbi:hypothetical protein AQUCO_03200002v1 [Aquilegia coerulea]|uniref:Uncharacterized protein n=1 Tax=Aquilegia coerulea TaxID=218851 RepID=A0A2G5CZQ7_AQUCA|nr:hypothetical protein AQUCO_03200002v1 [Aquilegia coerulea]